MVDPKQRVAEAVKKVTAIATLPEVTAKIITTVEDPRSSASQLHKIVAHDPALVTRILKVVNSAFYGLPGQIGSIERAIVLLGLNAVKNIAVAASLGQLFRGAKLCDGFTAKDLWTHCIAVGVAARELARQMKLPMADEAFLAGMIHDVGILISLQLSPEQMQAVCERRQGEHRQLLRAGARNHRDGPPAARHGPGRAVEVPPPLPARRRLPPRPDHPERPEPPAGHAGLRGRHDLLPVQSHGFNLTAVHQKLEDAGLAEIKLDPALITRTAANLDGLIEVAESVLG